MKKQPSLNKKPINWFLKGFTSRSISLESKWGKNSSKESMGSCNRSKEGICTEEDKGISIVKRREKRRVLVY